MVAKKISFTLLELVIVLVLVAILASIGMPMFVRTRQRAVDREARTNLHLIHAAQRVRELEDGSFVACADNNDCNADLGLELSPGTPNGNWDYQVTIPAAGTFRAEANGTMGTTNWRMRDNDDCACGADGQFTGECQN